MIFNGIILIFYFRSRRSSYTKDFLFLIMKGNLGDKAAYEYDKIIGSFDRHKFYNPDEIFSSGVGLESSYMPVKITSFESEIDSDLIKQWVRTSRFLVISTDIMFPYDYRTWW